MLCVRVYIFSWICCNRVELEIDIPFCLLVVNFDTVRYQVEGYTKIIRSRPCDLQDIWKARLRSCNYPRCGQLYVDFSRPNNRNLIRIMWLLNAKRKNCEPWMIPIYLTIKECHWKKKLKTTRKLVFNFN